MERTRIRKHFMVVLLLIFIFIVSACGSSQQSATGDSGQSNVQQNGGATGGDSGEKTYNLDLKTADEVMEYIKDMDPAERHEVLLQGAIKEGGPISFYMISSSEDAQHIRDAFLSDYPQLKLDVARSSADELRVRIENELRSNTHKVDVYSNLQVYLYKFNEQGWVTPYFTPNTSEFAEGLYDPNGSWAGMYVLLHNTAWNTNLMDASETPNRWEDLADPKYAGMFSLDVQDDLFLYYLRKTRGEEAGTELAKKIAANNPRLVRSRSQQLALLMAGEYAFSPAVYENYTIEAMEEGAPLDFKYLEGPVMAKTTGVSLVKHAPHPYGAILFMDWITSLKGQQHIADIGYAVPHPGVTYKNERAGVILKEGEIFDLNAEEYAPLLEKTYNDYKQIFGLTQ